MAWGLGYAHANGVIHRDVKPDNILLDQGSGRAMLADFGVAHAADGHAMTGTGQLIGTPQYMSPEQALGNPVDGQSDLYSLGATAFFSLTGRPLFDGPSPIAVVTKQLNELPPPLGSLRPDLPIELTRAMDRCLSQDPERRFASGKSGLTERDVPAPIRHYVRQGRSVALAWLMLAALILWFGRWVQVPPDPVSRTVAVLLLAIALLGPLAFLIRTARSALRSGLSFDDVRSAAALEARVLAEESRTVYGGEFSPDLKRTREDWLRMLSGPLGRLVFRLAGIGLQVRTQSPRPDSKPAERMLEAGAVELFNDLPFELRQRFEQLPEVGNELCCRVEELREEPGQQEELTRVIGALEQLRLDLMRLKAGEGSADQVSAAIDAAVRINQETGTRGLPQG